MANPLSAASVRQLIASIEEAKHTPESRRAFNRQLFIDEYYKMLVAIARAIFVTYKMLTIEFSADIPKTVGVWEIKFLTELGASMMINNVLLYNFVFPTEYVVKEPFMVAFDKFVKDLDVAGYTKSITPSNESIVCVKYVI